MRVDPLLKFSSNKSVGKLNLGGRGSHRRVVSYPLAKVQWEGTAEDWRVPSASWGRLCSTARQVRPVSRGQSDPRVRTLAVVSPAGTEPAWLKDLRWWQLEVQSLPQSAAVGLIPPHCPPSPGGPISITTAILEGACPSLGTSQPTTVVCQGTPCVSGCSWPTLQPFWYRSWAKATWAGEIPEAESCWCPH